MAPTGHSQVEQHQMSVETTVEASTEPDNVVIVEHYELKVCQIPTFKNTQIGHILVTCTITN